MGELHFYPRYRVRRVVVVKSMNSISIKEREIYWRQKLEFHFLKRERERERERKVVTSIKLRLLKAHAYILKIILNSYNFILKNL